MSIVFLVAGLFFAAIGVFLIRDHIEFRKKSRSTPGTVVAVEKYVSRSTRNGSRTYYSPIIDYVANGDNYRFTSGTGINVIKHKIDQRVPVLVAPDDPKNARLDSTMQYILGSVCLLMGLVACAVFYFTYEFSWWSLGIALFVIVCILSPIRKMMKVTGIRSIEDFKKAFKKAGAKSVVPGSEDDPLLDTEKTLYTDRRQLTEEVNKFAAIETITSFISIFIGLGMVTGGWYLYEKATSSSSPEMIGAYVLFGLGALISLTSLYRVLKSQSFVKRM